MQNTRYRALLLVLLIASMLCPVSAQVLDYRAQQSQHTTRPVVLYFPFTGTPWLGTQVRMIAASETISFEHAAVQALVDGPDAPSDSLSPPFPPGTQVLSVQPEGDLLFVTFNEALLGRYPDETLPNDLAQAQLRRRLAMAALVNTLTERGEYRRVQVLARAETNIRTSMRLAASYYLEDSDVLLDPLTRDEACILTPADAAKMTLDTWQKRDWRTLYDQMRDLRPSQDEVARAFESSLRLVAYAASTGTVAPDGISAVVSVTLDLQDEGGAVFSLPAFPLVLTRVGGVWRPQYESLLRLAAVRP